MAGSFACGQVVRREWVAPSQTRPQPAAERSGTVAAMRLGVLDVGSNTVHLLVVDAHPGARPRPATSHKVELQLAQHLRGTAGSTPPGTDALVRFVHSCLEVADDHGVEELLRVRDVGDPRRPQRRGGARAGSAPRPVSTFGCSAAATRPG